MPFSATAFSNAFKRCLKLARLWRSQIERTPPAEIKYLVYGVRYSLLPVQMPGYQEQTSQQLALLPHQHDF